MMSTLKPHCEVRSAVSGLLRSVCLGSRVGYLTGKGGPDGL